MVSIMIGASTLALVAVVKNVCKFVGVTPSLFTPYAIWFAMLLFFGSVLPKEPAAWSSDDSGSLIVESSAGVSMSTVIMAVAGVATWALW